MAMYPIRILLLLTFIEVNSEDQCKNNDSNQCNCYHSGDYEFQCPPDNPNYYLIQGIPDQELCIECIQLNYFNIDLLPDYKSGDNISLQLKSCPLPDNSYLPLLKKFDIVNLNSFTLEKINTPDSSSKQNITKNIFYGLSGLRDLTLTNVHNSLDDDFLDLLPNLLSLELEHCDIIDISSLKLPQSLKTLDLPRNKISIIPDGVFRNLSKLNRLHLCRNQIIHIKKESFIGLNKLTSLELSINNITDIEKGSFDNLDDLKTINLELNKLNKISEDIFKYNKNLTSIKLEGNLNLILPDYVFSNLSNLNLIDLKRSGIVTLPEHIFNNSTNIKTIMLQNNLINDLPKNVFNGLTGLDRLDLSSNKLDSLPQSIFSSLKSLTELNLSFNNISNISEALFKNTQNLQTLNLSYNRIAFIENNSFYFLKKLTVIDLSQNLWDWDGEFEEHPFTYCESLKKMILNDNNIKSFLRIRSLNFIEDIDLSYNQIKKFAIAPILTSEKLNKVKLTTNEITSVDFVDVNRSITNNVHIKKKIEVDLKGNPLTCECPSVNLISYLYQDMKSVKDRINLIVDGIHCSEPKSFQHVLITDLRPEQVTCEIRVKSCPKECKSFLRKYTNFVVFDCSNRNLTNFPRILTGSPGNIELNLTGNYIRGGLNSSLGYGNVKNLFLSNNQLQELKWIPAGIEILTLDSNNLTLLDPQLLKIMHNKTDLKTLKLSNNPWSCECSALELQIFLHDKKINSTEVICSDDNKPLLEKRQLCKPPSSLILLIVLPILSFLLLAIVGLVFYIYNRLEVKILINFCRGFLCGIDEEKLDKDKIYDIFICFSHKDQVFVEQNVIPVLKSGQFKTCIHFRDFVPGETILANIIYSITNSRKTLVILSNNFLESVWGIEEFKIAHTLTLEEGRTRLVVVKYGDLDENRLNYEMKAYLKTNTYIEWGKRKRLFRHKLEYALRHLGKNNNELTSPLLKHPESTPPVTTEL